MAVGIGASLFAATAGALWASLVGPLLRSLLAGGDVTWGPFQLSSEDLQLRLPLAIVGVAILRALAAWLHSGLMSRVSQGVLGRLREELYGRLLTLPPKWFEQRHSGELLSRFTSDVAQLEFASAQALASVTKDVLQVIGLLVVCFLTDWRLFLVFFIVLPGSIIPVSRFARGAKKQATQSQASLGQLSLMAAEQLHNLPVVQAFGAEGRALKRFDEEQDTYLSVMKRSLFIRGAFSPTTEYLGIIGVALAMVFGVKAVQAEPQLAGNLVSFLAAAVLVYQPVKSLSHTASQLSLGAGAATRLFEILDAAPDVDAGGEAGALGANGLSEPVEDGPTAASTVRLAGRSSTGSDRPGEGALTLDDVRLTYADGREALKGVSFSVRRGAHVALVGPSGAGKSSVFSLLLGHSVPSAGTVTWNGAPLSSLSRKSVRAQLGWVPQEPVLLSGTIRENLLLGRADASEAQLWVALERAHAADFVKRFAKGLDEDVGERGGRLSGGQRQRLAIARAFLKEPSLLLLDEPTSALDAETEREVQAGLEELMAGRTTLVIAHRLSTVRHADAIVVMADGRVVEQGTHDELVAKKGVYAQLHFPDGSVS